MIAVPCLELCISSVRCVMSVGTVLVMTLRDVLLTQAGKHRHRNNHTDTHTQTDKQTNTLIHTITHT